MRILLLAAACTLIFATAVSWGPGAALSDCAATRSACIDHCFGGERNLNRQSGDRTSGRQSACINRCVIAFCEDTPTVCRPTDRTVCNTSFQSCNGACEAAGSVPSAITQTQIGCNRACCVQFRACLGLRSCDVSAVACP